MTAHPSGTDPTMNHPSPDRTTRHRTTRGRRILAGALAAATLVAGAAFVPWQRGLTGAPTGDAQFAAALAPHLDAGYLRSVSAASVETDGTVRFAGWHAEEHDQFEIGSITKTFTAALLADAIERGELTAGTTLGEVFDELTGTSAGDLTMEQLATQHTGLPKSADMVPLGQRWRLFLRMDGYVETLPQMLERTAGLETDPGTYVYSNTGFALLGHAVAEAAGVPYPQLVQERLLDPLGMNETIVPQTYADLPAGAPAGHTDSGVPTGPWTLGAEAPAGSIRSTAHDMAIWMGAVADGSAPGVDAVEPRTELEDGDDIGYAWMTTPMGEDAEAADPSAAAVTWHNGGTGGYRSVAGFTPDGRALVVLSDTQTWVDAGLGYLAETGDQSDGQTDGPSDQTED